MKQNITLSLEKDLLLKLKVISAKRSTSISRMLADELKEIVEKTERYELSRRKALQAMESGLHLGGRAAPRDELHER